MNVLVYFLSSFDISMKIRLTFWLLVWIDWNQIWRVDLGWLPVTSGPCTIYKICLWRTTWQSWWSICMSLWSISVTEILWPEVMAFSIQYCFLQYFGAKANGWDNPCGALAGLLVIPETGKNEGDLSFSFLFSIRFPFLSPVCTSQNT